MPGCYLESDLADGESVYRIPLNNFPAMVGREIGLAVTLQSGNVSRRHAEFLDRDGQLLIHDLGSTNGTFVNHEPVTESRPLIPGDVIRFADVEFRLCQDQAAAAQQQGNPEFTKTAFFHPDEPVDRMPIGAQQFEELLRDRMIKPLFQAIISVDDGRMTGLELLGRGSHPGLSQLPVPLFFLAEGLGRAVDLSEAIREVGVQAWADSTFSHIPLFMNTQPGELKDCRRLIGSLRTLRKMYPDKPLVLEIHEQAVTDQETLATLHRALQRMNIQLAYDDFGAGQARLLELLNIPPYAVKFDISLIRDIHQVSRDRQEMVGLLVKMVQKGRAFALAEGVSQSAELEVCRQLNFDLIQGFVYGEPVPLAQLAKIPGGP